MAELVPDSWRLQEEDQGSKCCHQPKRQRRGPVTDILLWVECYSSLVGVLSTGFPTKTPELMAYQRTIVRAHRSFLGEGWVTYDTCFCRRAAATKSLDWGQVDFTLYNETFTGRAKPISRCRHCSSEHHTSTECSFAPEPPRRSSNPRMSFLPPRPEVSQQSNQQPAHRCKLYNHKLGDRCRFNPCKFRHACTECNMRGHPASQCRGKPGSRDGSPGRARN